MKKVFRFTFLVLILIGLMSVFTKVDAASASIKSSSSSVYQNDSVTITVTIKAATWNLEVSGGGISKAQKYVDTTDDGENATITKTLKLDTSAKGTKTITLKGDVSDGTTGKTDTVNQTINVEVKEKTGGTTTNNSTPSKSSDATLKSITVGGKTYSKPSTSISAPNVSANTSSIKISATTNNSKATVKGTGTKDLKTGTNKFTLTVTAENGATKKYTITIVRLAEESQEPNLPDENNQEQKKELRLTSIQIEGVELAPEFREDLFEYSAYIFDLTDLKVNAVPNDPEAQVEITGNTGLVLGENVILIKLTKGETSAEYKINVTKMQIEEPEDETQNTIQEESKTPGFVEIWRQHGTAMILYSTILIITRSSYWIWNNNI